MFTPGEKWETIEGNDQPGVDPSFWVLVVALVIVAAVGVTQLVAIF